MNDSVEKNVTFLFHCIDLKQIHQILFCLHPQIYIILMSLSIDI